jgi:hypothetical protein
MSSFIRVSDIPPDELHLLPIIGLRQQIGKDRSRPISPNGRTEQGERDSSLPVQTFRTAAEAAEVWAVAGGRFVTDWQMKDELRPSSPLPFDKDDIDDEDRDDDDFDDEDFEGSKDEDAGEEEKSCNADENYDTGKDFDALYVDIGGEG